MDKLQSLQAERADLYKRLKVVKQQIAVEQDRLDRLRSRQATLKDDIVRFLKTNKKYSSKTISAYPCNQVYLDYVRWTRHYHNITVHKFTRQLKELGIKQRLVRKATSVYRVYCS